jgi:hypothetical protein
MGRQGEAGVPWGFITRGGMVYGGFGLYGPWRGLGAWDWARMAVERVREGQRVAGLCCKAMWLQDF